MADLTAMLQAAAGQAGEDTDPNFNQTTLLLHGDGTNGAQNNTFLDSSTNNFTITRNGNTTQGTFSPFSLPNGEWSGYFAGGATSYIQTDGTTLFDQNAAATFQCWIYPTQFLTSTSAVRRMYIFVKGVIFAGLSIHSDGTLGWYGFPGGTIVTSSPSGTIVTNQWQHIAIVMNPSSNYIKLYKNGVEVGTSAYSAFGTNGAALRIGIGDTAQSATDAFIGYMSNVKVSASVATLDYASPAVPSTTSGAGLLTLQANRFYDASGNRTVTPFAAVSIQPFSPFAPSAAYSTSVNGGSGYFDGSGDNLTATNNAAYDFGSGAFTIEGWARPTTASQLAFAARGQSTGFVGWILSTTNFLATTNGSTWNITITFTSALVANSWNHVAVVRNGDVYTAYLNGVANGTTTVSGSIVAGTAATIIGQRAGQTDYSGYIANFRIVKGTAVYTAAFTPPTAPLTAITNTELLCNFTNAGIFDNTGKNNLETVGNAQIDTSVKKYGTGSMEFDGTGDALVIPASINLAPLTGDFTYEAWVRAATSNAVLRLVFGIDNYASGQPFRIYQLGTVFRAYVTGTGASDFIESSTIATDTFYHLALTRSGTTITFWLDGVSQGTKTSSTSFPVSIFRVGLISSGIYPFSGYIDDLRITKGVARYTAAFTPPDAPFPDQ